MTEKAKKKIIMRNGSLLVPTSVSEFELRETLMGEISAAQLVIVSDKKGTPSANTDKRRNLCTIIDHKWNSPVHIADNMPKQDKASWADTLKIKGIAAKEISPALV